VKLKDASKREALNKFLADRQIPSMIYYPVPNHLQKAYSYYGYKVGDMANTENLCSRVISFPIHTEMDAEQQNLIISAVLEFINH